MAETYDVVIIGAGVIGSAVARELSRYQVKVCVLEKESDVCEGTSKANSAIVHAGYDAKPGSLKARMNREGCRLMPAYAKELDFPYNNCGSLVICKEEEGLPALKALYERGLENGIEDLHLLTGDEARTMEPHLTDKTVGALYAGTAGIVDPFLLTIALADNACVNGAVFRFNEKAEAIEKDGSLYRITTGRGCVCAAAVVNAAGIYADVIHNMVSSHKLHITPRIGEYCLLDKDAGRYVTRTVFEQPGRMGKGVLVSPTVHGNLLLGPTAEDRTDRDDTATTAKGLEAVIARAADNVEALPGRAFITSFAGLRAHEDGGDFILGEAADAPLFFDCAGIESPGLTSAPAIGRYMAGLIAGRLSLTKKDNFIEKRQGTVPFASLTAEEQNRLIAADPAYGRIVCRCERITEGEILDAIRRPLGATTLDGVKRRVRAGMGRCQGGFCSPKTLAILAREGVATPDEVTKKGPGSALTEGRTKA